ncbi:hypothetical protein C0V73_22780 [Rhizobium sp. TH135]|uniref:hypothetical protein n=1 Tax=Rhizobium sp. TH135 TaxID=2067451 RepID=UPI000C7DED0B|nr:hypothetical protein [Rhizobium sp. TH135]PLK68698.1 hypothetical protein C0V73_22780 [Rhizobium sp. TH135]
MKWLRTIIVFDKGNVIGADDWRLVHESYVRSIASIDNPAGSGKLMLRRKERVNGDWKRNGVNYLRSRFLQHMTVTEGWHAEAGVELSADHAPPVLKLYPSLEEYQEPIASRFGGFDFVTRGPDGLRVAIEWETGNISSSHRSMNKLAIALANKVVDVGVLIVPSRLLYEHLTDRVGNIYELSGYLEMWHGLGEAIESGVLAITVVEHDELTDDAVPFLTSGEDGNAKRARARKASTSET